MPFKEREQLKIHSLCSFLKSASATFGSKLLHGLLAAFFEKIAFSDPSTGRQVVTKVHFY